MILDSTKILFFYGAHLASLSCQIIFWRKDSTFVMRAPGYSIGSLTQVALHTQYLNCRLTQKYSWGSRCSWLLNSSNSGVDFSMDSSLFLFLLLFSFYSSFLSLFSFFFFLFSFSFCFISLKCHLSLGFERESNGCLVSQLSLQVVPA